MKEIKPCVLCGGKEISFKYDMSYGHGESGYSNARMECKCGFAFHYPKNFGYGDPSEDPSEEEKRKAIEWWNSIKLKSSNE